MVRKKSEQAIEHTNIRGGIGEVEMQKILNGADEMYGKGRMFSHITVAPHSGIGYHEHDGDTEIYYVLSGKAAYNDNGTITTIEKGDVTFTPSGFGHGVDNKSDEPVELIALIIYD